MRKKMRESVEQVFGTELRNGESARIWVEQLAVGSPFWKAYLDTLPTARDSYRVGRGELKLSHLVAPRTRHNRWQLFGPKQLAAVLIEAVSVNENADLEVHEDQYVRAGVATALLYTALQHTPGVDPETKVVFGVREDDSRESKALCAWAGHVGLWRTVESNDDLWSAAKGNRRFEASVAEVMEAIQINHPEVANGSVVRAAMPA